MGEKSGHDEGNVKKPDMKDLEELDIFHYETDESYMRCKVIMLCAEQFIRGAQES